MGKKPGHCKFREIRKALRHGKQIFEGYPHRRHRKMNKLKMGQRTKIIERIKEQEISQALKTINYNYNDENL